jgi:hypothetical protein
MLFSQIPGNILKKISADLSVNLGLISVTLKERDTQQTRFDKLKVVTKYINEHAETGTVDDPGSYFKGTVPMRWGPIDSNAIPGFVYFAGETDRTIFGVAGSTRHVIGIDKGGSGFDLQMSIQYNILENLMKFYRDIDSSIDGKPHQYTTQNEEDTLRTIAWATSSLKGPETRLEFLAKRLIEGLLDSKHILLGTPIYVAYAD